MGVDFYDEDANFEGRDVGLKRSVGESSQCCDPVEASGIFH